MEKLILPAIHLSVLLGFIIYKTKGPFMSFVRTRHQDVNEGLNRSKIQAAQAESKKKEVESKFASLQAEKEKIFSEWKEREQAQLASIKDNSQKLLSMMKSESEQNKKALEETIRAQIMKKFAEQIVVQAEEKIKKGLTAESQAKMNEQFMKEVLA